MAGADSGVLYTLSDWTKLCKREFGPLSLPNETDGNYADFADAVLLQRVGAVAGHYVGFDLSPHPLVAWVELSVCCAGLASSLQS